MKLTKFLVVASINGFLLYAASWEALAVEAPRPTVQTAERIARSIDGTVDRALTMMTAILEASPQDLGASRSLSLFSQSEPFPIYDLDEAPLKLSPKQHRLLSRQGRLYFYVSGTMPSIMLVVRDDQHRAAMIRFPISALAKLISRGNGPDVQALLAVRGQLFGASSLTVDEQVAASSLTGSRVKSTVIAGVPLAFAPTRIAGVGVLVRQGEGPALTPPRALPAAAGWLEGAMTDRRLPPLIALGLAGALAGTLGFRQRRRRRKRSDGADPSLDLVAWVQLSKLAERSILELKGPLASALTRLDALIDGHGLRSGQNLQAAAGLAGSLGDRSRALGEDLQRLEVDHASPRSALLTVALDVALLAIRTDQRDPWLQKAATQLRELADPLEAFLARDEAYRELQEACEGMAHDLDLLAQKAGRLHQAEQLLESTSAQASTLAQSARQLSRGLRQRFERLGSSKSPSEEFRCAVGAARQQLALELAKVLQHANENRHSVGEVTVILDGCQDVLLAGASPVSGASERTGLLMEQLASLLATRDVGIEEPAREVILALERAVHLLEAERALSSEAGLRESLRGIIQLLRDVLAFETRSARELQLLKADGTRLARLLSATLRRTPDQVPSCEDVYAELAACKTHLQAARIALKQLHAALAPTD